MQTVLHVKYFKLFDINYSQLLVRDRILDQSNMKRQINPPRKHNTSDLLPQCHHTLYIQYATTLVTIGYPSLQ